MIVLGLDPGLGRNKLGLVLLQTEPHWRILAHGHGGSEVRDRLTGRSRPDALRRGELVRFVEEFLRGKVRPDLAGIERQYTEPIYGDEGERRARGRKAYDALRLSDLCADLIAFLAGEGIRVVRVPPLSVNNTERAMYELALTIGAAKLSADELSAAIIALHAEADWRRTRQQANDPAA